MFVTIQDSELSQKRNLVLELIQENLIEFLNIIDM